MLQNALKNSSSFFLINERFAKTSRITLCVILNENVFISDILKEEKHLFINLLLSFAFFVLFSRTSAYLSISHQFDSMFVRKTLFNCKN